MTFISLDFTQVTKKVAPSITKKMEKKYVKKQEKNLDSALNNLSK
jgi:hypothetical protein